MKTLTMKIS